MDDPFNFEPDGTVKINSDGLILNDEHIEAFIDDCIKKLQRTQEESNEI